MRDHILGTYVCRRVRLITIGLSGRARNALITSVVGERRERVVRIDWRAMPSTRRIEEVAMREWDPDHIALVSAIEGGKFDKACEILAHDDQNKYIHPVGPLKVTALQVAAWKGKIDLLERLYETGADVNVADKIGRCPIYYAADRGYADVTAWLLQHGAHVDPKVGIHSCSKEISYPTLTRSCLVGKNVGTSPRHRFLKLY